MGFVGGGGLGGGLRAVEGVDRADGGVRAVELLCAARRRGDAWNARELSGDDELGRDRNSCITFGRAREADAIRCLVRPCEPLVRQHIEGSPRLEVWNRVRPDWIGNDIVELYIGDEDLILGAVV